MPRSPMLPRRARPRKMPNPRRTPVPQTMFFAHITFNGDKQKAPVGYAFDGRGDLIRTQPKKAALRSAARRARGMV